MGDDRPVAKAFALIADLYNALHDRPVPLAYPQSCWEYAVDERWFIALNGSEQTRED